MASQVQWSRRHALSLASSRLPRTMFFACSARHCCTRRCSVRNCDVPAYASGTAEANRASSSLAVTVGSLISHCSTIGQACANGSARVFHHRVAPGCLRCLGRTSPSFQAVDRLCRNEATSAFSGELAGSSDGGPDSSASRCWPSRMVCRSSTGSSTSNCSRSADLLAAGTSGRANSRSHGVVGA